MNVVILYRMSDRLTQLQDMINQQAEYFCNSVGILQQFSTPSKFSSFDKTGTPQQNQTQDQDYAGLFATLIARTAKDIDALIESLPADDASLDGQVQSLGRLEQENQDACKQLEDKVHQGELLLTRIQAALLDIAQSQLDMQNPISDNPLNPNLNLMVPPIKQEMPLTLSHNVANGHPVQESSENTMTQ